MSTVMILVDCEATGATPYSGKLTEFGAVEFTTRDTFEAHLYDTEPHPDIPALPVIRGDSATYDHAQIFTDFAAWLKTFDARPVFVSDNPAFDWMWIADGFDRHLGHNPFGHSARRIGDLAAGLSGNWKSTSSWKRHRKTPHTHRAVEDAMGNAEALEHILRKYDQKF